ncbi:flagellar biosynthesis protein FlhB [Gammaproteobacteria bacterium]|nr:flagellar biosynthesis protein FlhB [Gammaproteobacteria bacterium]
MAENSAQERSEQATPKRKEDSRKKGQVPRSKELNTVASLLAAGIGMAIFGRNIITDITEMLRDSLRFDHTSAYSETIISTQLSVIMPKVIFMLSPLFILLTLVTIISPLSLGGWVFSGSQIAPKMERISFFKGLGRIFSSKSLMELLKAIAKFILVGGVTVFVISQVISDIFVLPLLPVTESLNSTGNIFIWCFLGFSSVLILVTLIDVPYQLWDFGRQIMMTKQEIKDEMKEMDGRPEVKNVIRERQREFAQQRMMVEVPLADVIITNPTHFAVALRYDQAGTGAPKVVAKGRDLIAAKIREVAKEHGVAIFSAPPLARALYSSTELNQEIPGNLFLAVAQVLAYIFQLKRAKAAFKTKPKPPKNLPVPDEYADGGLT